MIESLVEVIIIIIIVIVVIKSHIWIRIAAVVFVPVNVTYMRPNFGGCRRDRRDHS